MTKNLLEIERKPYNKNYETNNAADNSAAKPFIEYTFRFIVILVVGCEGLMGGTQERETDGTGTGTGTGTRRGLGMMVLSGERG